MRGSPPHTRDKLKKAEEMLKEVRITPAYAGQIYFLLFGYSLLQDHPRIRGTNMRQTLRCPLQIGSPPHTRDK